MDGTFFVRRDKLQTLGFLGPRGTHSEAAAMFLSDKIGGAELRPYPDIFSVMQAAADGEVDSCVVPVENSLEGAVNITMLDGHVENGGYKRNPGSKSWKMDP